MTEKCEYVSRGERLFCRGENEADFVVTTGALHCTPGMVRFFCSSCLMQRGRSTGFVLCQCREIRQPHLDNIISIVRIPKENKR